MRFRIPWFEVNMDEFMHYTYFLRYCEIVEEEFINSLNIDFNDLCRRFNISFYRFKVDFEFNYPVSVNQYVRVDLDVVRVDREGIEYFFSIWNEDEGKLSCKCRFLIKASIVVSSESLNT